MYRPAHKRSSTAVASVVLFFQLGLVALACPMPMDRTMPDDAAMSAECAESHGSSVPDRMPSELCKARMAAEGTALVRDRAGDASAQIADVALAPAATLQAVPVRAMLDTGYAYTGPHFSSPPHLKFRVIRI